MKGFGFDPVADDDARVLILGTLPSAESLRDREYYANKQNVFWWIIGELVGASPSKNYSERLEALKRNHIALWDVCASADRKGSLDSKIVMSSVVPNDFRRFFEDHSRIELVCFNGKPAEKIFRRKVLKVYPDPFAGIRREVLPSTSRAYAAMPRHEKLRQWRKVFSEFIGVQRGAPGSRPSSGR